jgi:hypothetical protein
VLSPNRAFVEDLDENIFAGGIVSRDVFERDI